MAREKAIHFGPPPFHLSDIGPCKLSWSTPPCSSWFSDQMWVFWSTYNDELQHVNPQLRARDIFTGDTVTKDKIKYILQRPRLFEWGQLLVQFWGLVKIGDKMYLTTCDQPFALSHFNREGAKRLCEFRKLCLNYLMPVLRGVIFQEEEHGPHGRVFYSGLPEYVDDIGHYSRTEYPLYDYAVDRVKQCWVLPVKIPPGNSPIGVLEIVSSEDSFPDTHLLEVSFAEVLKDIGLTDQIQRDFFSGSFYLRANSCQGREIARIDKVLEVVRKTHQLTLAQTWMQKSVKALIAVGSTSWSTSELLGLIGACRMCIWPVGQGVVGKAFSSKEACYCRDVKRLSIKEYPMVPSAREYGKYEFAGCFAVCLQSSCSKNCTYTLEFFLPSNETNNGDPNTLLHELMLTLKEQLQGSFKIASGQELGQKLFVEVIKVSSDDTLDSFEICHTFGSESAFGAVEVHSRGRMMPPDYSSHQVNAVNYSVNGVHEQQFGFVGSPPAAKPMQNIVNITHQQPNVKLDAVNRDRDSVSLEQGGNGTTVLRNQGSSYTVDRDDVNLEQSGRKQGSSYTFDKDDCVSLEQSGKIQVSIHTFDRDNSACLEQSGNDATALRKQGSSYTLKSERGITCEILEQNSTMKLGDAAKHLGGNLTRSNLLISSNFSLIRNDIDFGFLHVGLPLPLLSVWEYSMYRLVVKGICLSTEVFVYAVSRSTLKRICRDYGIHRWPPHKARKNNQAFTQEKIARPFVENNEGQWRLDASRQQEHGSITVKAAYGGDIIKFQLSFSARKMDLEQKVAQRLNLLVGSFKIKYLDEDDDWVLMPCDDDLTRALSTLRLLGSTTVKMLVESLQNSLTFVSLI